MHNLDQNEYRIAIIGLGYVGLPLAVEFSKKYTTFGFDNNSERIDQLINGIDNTLETKKDELKTTHLIFTKNEQEIEDCNVYIITVPTPVDKNKKPDMSYLKSASKTVGKLLNNGDTVIYESTVYPGATEEFCVPILEKESKLTYNNEFFCGYSPERINPGDKNHSLINIKKITSGSNDNTAKLIDNLYSSIIKVGTYKASSIAVAEAAKVIENIQRDVNIALINELSILFHKLNLNTVEVLEAAGTKWNFLPFRPGLVGGHCIGVDPYYLTYKAKEVGYKPEMILAGRRINDSMGKFIADSTIQHLVKLGKNPIGSKVAIFGLTFKENCPDIRNTKVLSIIKCLKEYNCEILVTDAFANNKEVKKMFDIDLINQNKIKNVDAVILSVAHDQYKLIPIKEWKKIIKNKGVIVDVKSIFNYDFFNDTDIQHWQL
jgi:UDP-N-acetyl-D-galactosamine dehydrogenase